MTRAAAEQRPTVSGARLAQAVSDLLQFAVAAAIASLAAYAIWNQLPDELDVRTDIVGNPVYANFNVNRYFWLYWLIVGFIPLATLGLFLVLRRLIPRSAPTQRPRLRIPSPEAPVVSATPAEVATVGAARLLLVGAILGLEAAFAFTADSDWVLSVGLPVMAGYAALCCLGAVALGGAVRIQATFWERLSLVNAIGIAFCIAALYAVSHATQVTVAASGEVHEYSWFPLWLAAPMTAAALAWVARGVIGARTAAELRALERRLLIVVAGPVVVFLFVALLPGAWTGIDMFHEGELLAGARLVEEGAFPWRDVLFIHGLLTDAGFQILGFNVFEESRWGYVAGTLVLVVPLYWISFYYLFAYLFHRNWLFFVGTQLALILGVVYEGALRFILLPLVLVLLGALLSKPSRLRAFLFMTVVVAQTVVTPEAALAAVAVLLTVVAFEAYYYDRSRPLKENFRRTLMCAGAGALLTAIWAVFLLSFGAFDEFVSAYLTFASDHQLTGGVPVHWINDRFRFAAIAPVVLVVAGFWFFALQILRRGSLTIADWVMGALALFVALYYQKFLARADLHVFQPYALAIPLIFYALYRLIDLAEAGVRRFATRVAGRLPVRLAITAIAVLILLVEAPRTVAEVVEDAPRRLSPTAAREPTTRAIGFFSAEGQYDELLREVDDVLNTYLGPDDEVFDFSNSPAVFHYFLERRPATRYYHVSMAIREETQEDLVDELERERPELVVFSSATTGLGSWDFISNQVRHYRVSQYLLDRYRPLLLREGFVFMARKDAEPRKAASQRRPVEKGPSDLYFRTYPCDWGYAPNFLTIGPNRRAATPPLSLSPETLGRLLSVTGWAIDRDTPAPAAKVLAAVNGKVVAQAVPSGHRPDIADLMNDQAFLASGFTLEVPPGSLPRGGLQTLRVYAFSRSGKATEIGYGPGVTWALGRPPGPRHLRLGRRSIPVVAQAAQGFADAASVAKQVVSLDVPRGTPLDAYDWLEVETRSPLQVNGFLLTDRVTRPDRGIIFRTLARGDRTVRVLVGACSQWHGYESARLYLRADHPEQIAAVRLYR